MKYTIKKLSEDFILDELELVRKQFVDALTYTMESTHVLFDKKASDPLDIYLEYDFQQKHGENVVYGFNLRDEIVANFSLDGDRKHSSSQLLTIGKSLRELADEIDRQYDAEPKKTLADIEEKNDKKATEYAESINRSYRQVLKDALAEDQVHKKRSVNKFMSYLMPKKG